MTEKEKIVAQEMEWPAAQFDDLLPYIKNAGQELEDFLRRKKTELKERYNPKNLYQDAFDRFGWPTKVPGKYLEEYMLINRKQSKQPACIRAVIADICSLGLNYYLIDDYKKKEELKKADPKTENTEL